MADGNRSIADAAAREHLREPPVEDLDLAERADHDVGGLQVAVDDAAAVRVGDRAADLLEDAEEGVGPERLDAINRAMRRAAGSEIERMERYLPFLATTASSAPFIGLFGTVWGIMTSFQSIGAQGSANLAVVAPGISEALVATAAGLGAAIPAVMGYNFYVNRVKYWASEMDGFSLDLLNALARSSQKTRVP